MSADLICPGCGSPVPGSDLMGYIERGVYDGVIIWTDNRCGHSWPRFPDGRLHEHGARKIAGWDAVRLLPPAAPLPQEKP